MSKMSKLIAKDPLDVDIKERMKLFAYGAPGVGKTLTSLEFPSPYYIDVESGGNKLAYRKILKQSGGAYVALTDYDEIVGQVRALMVEKHDYKTLIIDPITVIYHDLINYYEPIKGTDFSKHRTAANTDIGRLFSLLIKLDMNVVVTAYEKAEYKNVTNPNGKTTLVNTGITFDSAPRSAHIFDLALHVRYSEKNSKLSEAYVEKTRYKKEFPRAVTFPYTYESLTSRYDGECLNAVAVPIEFASKSQVTELNRLIKVMNYPADKVSKWLSAGKADRFEDMQSEHVQKCIDKLNTEINSTEE